MGWKRKRKKEPKESQGTEEILEAPLAPWKRLVRPRTFVVFLLALLLFVLVITALRLYNAVSSDLVLVLNPEAMAVTLPHGSTAEVSFDLRTNNYLLCEASCDARVEDLAGGTVVEEWEGIALKDSNSTLTFTLDAPRRGEGLRHYRLSAECRNVERRLCLRSGAVHRTAALITLNYTLTDDEADARESLSESLPSFLSEARSADVLIQQTQGAVADLRGDGRVPLDGLEDVSALAAARASLLDEQEGIVRAWREGDYIGLAGRSLPDAEAIAASANATVVRLAEYVAAQNALTDALAAETRNLTGLVAAQVFASYGEDALLERAESAELRLGNLATGLSDEPAASALTRTGELASYRSEVAALEANATALVRSEVAAGNLLLWQEDAKLALALNTTRVAPQVGLDGVTDLSGALAAAGSVCAELALLKTELEAANLSALNATGALLGRCIDQSVPVSGRSIPSSFEKVSLRVSPVTSAISAALPAPQSRCCALDGCAPCGEAPYPILFLHGHSAYERNLPEYSLEAFTLIQRELQAEGLYADAGHITPYSSYVPVPDGAWRLPVSVSGTYYYDAYLSGGSYILSVAKSESIDTYAIRTRDLVDTLRTRTGSPKVVIVAHSMGGLVARRYLQLFGDDAVDRLVLVGTPNHGVNASVATICPYIGADKECDELRAGSPMLSKINDPQRQPKIPVTVIVGSGCDTDGSDGDGVAAAASVALASASNVVVEGKCTSLAKLHTALLDPEQYPETYTIIKNEIKRSKR